MLDARHPQGARLHRCPLLAAFCPGFEICPQFDSLRSEAQLNLRGADLTRIRRQALEHLEAAGISTTLAVVVKQGVNDDELPAIMDHALEWRCVRGVGFQPVQDAGRNAGFAAPWDRFPLSAIRRRIVDAGGPFGDGDIIPLPCNPESIAIGYAPREGATIAPVGTFFPREMLVEALPNAITFETSHLFYRDAAARARMQRSLESPASVTV